MSPKTFHFVTGNPNKLAEVKAILGETVVLKSTPLDLVEIQGNIQEIIRDKCRRACEIVRHYIYRSVCCCCDDQMLRLFFSLFFSRLKDPRTGSGGRYFVVFQCLEGASGAVYVSLLDYSKSFGSTRQIVPENGFFRPLVMRA